MNDQVRSESADVHGAPAQPLAGWDQTLLEAARRKDRCADDDRRRGEEKTVTVVVMMMKASCRSSRRGECGSAERDGSGEAESEFADHVLTPKRR